MGQNLFDADPSYFHRADELLGFSLTDIMFSGTDEDLKQTKVTQPAVFLHSVAQAFALGDSFQPDLVAGHSLGEFSALVAAGALSFEDGLKLVYTRALAMQKACEAQPSTMAAILGLPDETVENICAATDGVVVAANYNSPGQLVISRAELAAAIAATTFHQPVCPVVQNVVALAVSDPAQIQENLIAQLTGPVKWTQSVQAMGAAGIGRFVEVGPGKVLQGLVKKILPEAEVLSA
jgi:[acyl-carrier-protein] S-malonyltransferase